MSEAHLSDETARQRALDISRSFIVQAPAGSGKTTVLTQRYLRLLAAVDEPEQVLAITFTRKAAGEMRERVQKALDGDIEVRSPADALTLGLAQAARANATLRGWGIEDSAARLRIQTIDAFNGYLANALPITSKNGFGRSISDSPRDLFEAAARETLRGAERDPEFRASFERILRRLDDSWSGLEHMVAELLPLRAQWLPNLPQLSGAALVPKIEQSLATLVSEDLALAVARLPSDFLIQASALARYCAQHVDAEKLPDIASWRGARSTLSPALTDLARWRCVARLALTKELRPRQQLTKNDGIPPDDILGKTLKDDWLRRLKSMDPRHVAALVSIYSLPDPVIPERERAAIDALARLLLLAVLELERLFNAYGECDHTAVAGAASQALREDSSPTPLAERIGTRLMHILVDEFQDTSRDQYDLLLALTEEWTDGDGHTLFLVGDPMQSIYGFRNAEVGRFSTVREGKLGALKLEPLELRRNFRSALALVEWHNDTFARVFPAEDDPRRGAVRHLASVAAREELEGGQFIYRVAGARAESGHAESEDVAERIAALMRERSGESIAVLASARTHLRAVRAALASRSVPFIGVNLEPLADVAAVRDLEALSRALEAPLDRVAWLAVLRAPFIGLSLADLTAVSGAGEDSTIPAVLSDAIPGVSLDGNARLMRARSVLLGGWQGRERETRAHLVERVWLALGGASAYANHNELAHARRFLAALDEEDRKRLRGRPADLARLMTTLYAEDPAQPGAVSLMTIHGAKGLEFDHVFVVGVGRLGRGDEARLLNWLEIPRKTGGDLLLMAPIRMRGEDVDAEDDAINRYLRLSHKERQREERSRLAYVALTRAKRTLHVYIHPRVREAEGLQSFSPTANSLLHTLWPALEAGLDGYPVIGDDEPPEEILPAVTQSRHRLVRHPALIEPPADVLARGAIVPLGAEEEIEFSWARQTARRVGTVVHEALERFGTQLPSVSALPKLRARLESRLEALGVEPDAARAGAERALTALRATLEDVNGRWLFDAAHRDAHSELALTGVRGGLVVNAVIDRTFVDDQGTRWIVDFKTSPHEGGDLAAFLDSEAVRYEAQLKRYAHLARELGPEPVRAGLYFPLLSAWREVDVGS